MAAQFYFFKQIFLKVLTYNLAPIKLELQNKVKFKKKTISITFLKKWHHCLCSGAVLCQKMDPFHLNDDNICQ